MCLEFKFNSSLDFSECFIDGEVKSKWLQLTRVQIQGDDRKHIVPLSSLSIFAKCMQCIHCKGRLGCWRLGGRNTKLAIRGKIDGIMEIKVSNSRKTGGHSVGPHADRSWPKQTLLDGRD